jgi:hypothetical protein
MSKIEITIYIPDYEGLLGEFVSHATKRIRQRMKEKMNEPKSGKRYGSHTASAPSEAPASRTKTLENSLQIEEKTLESRLFSNVGYAALLENGTSKMASRPLWETSVDELIPELEIDLDKLAQKYATTV